MIIIFVWEFWGTSRRKGLFLIPWEWKKTIHHFPKPQGIVKVISHLLHFSRKKIWLETLPILDKNFDRNRFALHTFLQLCALVNNHVISIQRNNSQNTQLNTLIYRGLLCSVGFGCFTPDSAKSTNPVWFCYLLTTVIYSPEGRVFPFPHVLPQF